MPPEAPAIKQMAIFFMKPAKVRALTGDAMRVITKRTEKKINPISKPLISPLDLINFVPIKLPVKADTATIPRATRDSGPSDIDVNLNTKAAGMHSTTAANTEPSNPPKMGLAIMVFCKITPPRVVLIKFIRAQWKYYNAL